MKQKLFELIPEFEQIKNSDLKEKTVNCWIEALEMGGWQVEDLDRIPFTLLISPCPTSFLTHVRAVTKVAIESARVLDEHYHKEYQLDFDIIVSGGLLHDIGKLLEYQETDSGFIKSGLGKLLRHPFSGAGLAMKHGLPDKVLHMIATHAKEGDLGYRCPEAVIVHHADFMNFEPLKG